MFSVCRGENQNAKTGTAKSRQHHPGDGHRWVSKRDRKDLSEDSRYQDATRPTRSGPAKSRSSHGNRHGSRRSAEAPHDKQGGPRQDRSRTAGEMGGAEAATGPTGQAQEAEVVGGGVEGHKGSHEEALGGLPQSPKGCGVGPRPARTTAAPIATDCESVLTTPLLGPWNGPTDRRLG